MTETMFPVFKINGEDYVAAVDLVLTSNPPQYNAYRLSDREHRYVYCSDVNYDFYMRKSEFYAWIRDSNYESADVLVHKRAPTALELLTQRVSDLEDTVEELNKTLGSFKNRY